VELPWCQRHITSAWRLQSRLEGEVETLKRVNATLQATSEEALAAADHRTGVLQQQVAALQQQMQQQMQHAESNVQVVVAEYERRMSALTTAVQVTKQELMQRQVKVKDLTGVVAREQARANTARAEAADAQSKLNASLLATRQLERKLQAVVALARNATAKSARLTAELERANAKIEDLQKRSCHDSNTQQLEDKMTIEKLRTANEAAEESLKFYVDWLPKMNQKDDMRRAELSQKAGEITRLKETMAKLHKEVQGKALQIEAMEEDKRKMKGSLTHEIRRLEEGAADAAAAAARVRHELEEARAEKAQVKAQLIDAKVDIVRERSKATADLREKIRCLELDLTSAHHDVASLRRQNSHLQEKNESLHDETVRSLLVALVKTDQLEELKARQSGQRQAVKAGTAASAAMLSG
ncbi:hypothetical protein Vretifemale_16692, partial [Volvox reticuliferus]